MASYSYDCHRVFRCFVFEFGTDVHGRFHRCDGTRVIVHQLDDEITVVASR